jgi:tetratricopeptide (TPR) repeat protein
LICLRFLEGTLNDHPSPEELQAFWRGDLDTGGVRAVVRHFLKGCRRCSSLLAPQVSALFAFAPVEEETDKGYDAMLDRVLAAAASGDGQAAGAAPPEFETLLDRCLTLRYEDPARMVEVARLAAFLADRLDARRYGARQVADLRCRGWAELANAYRVADRLSEAEEALEIAAECQVEGTGDAVLGARLLEVQASLDADRRRFPEALATLDAVRAVHLRNGDRHLAGRALLKKGLYAGYDCDPEQAILLLEEGLALIDRERDPELVFGAMHNLARSLMECGRPQEARELVRSNHFGDTGGRVNRLKVLWLEAQIDAALGDLDRAEAVLEQVFNGFEEIGLRYKAAVAGLELAAVHLRQGRMNEARRRALSAVEVFSRLGIGRELMATLLVLRDAFERQAATVALLESVVVRLARLEREPSA